MTIIWYFRDRLATGKRTVKKMDKERLNFKKLNEGKERTVSVVVFLLQFEKFLNSA
jgi:hypothetical protein